MIGCEVDKYLAQQIADETGLCVKTLRCLREEPIFKGYGSGRSRLIIDGDLKYFCYGYIFEDPSRFQLNNSTHYFFRLQQPSAMPLKIAIPLCQTEPELLFVFNMNNWLPV